MSSHEVQIHPSKEAIIETNSVPRAQVAAMMMRGNWVDANALFTTRKGEDDVPRWLFNEDGTPNLREPNPPKGIPDSK